MTRQERAARILNRLNPPVVACASCGAGITGTPTDCTVPGAPRGGSYAVGECCRALLTEIVVPAVRRTDENAGRFGLVVVAVPERRYWDLSVGTIATAAHALGVPADHNLAAALTGNEDWFGIDTEWCAARRPDFAPMVSPKRQQFEHVDQLAELRTRLETLRRKGAATHVAAATGQHCHSCGTSVVARPGHFEFWGTTSVVLCAPACRDAYREADALGLTLTGRDLAVCDAAAVPAYNACMTHGIGQGIAPVGPSPWAHWVDLGVLQSHHARQMVAMRTPSGVRAVRNG